MGIPLYKHFIVFLCFTTPTVCITNTTDPNIRTLKENLLSKYCKINIITIQNIIYIYI